MRIILIILITVIIQGANSAFADATIDINNYGSLNPIYLFKDQLLPVEGSHVQLIVHLKYGYAEVQNVMNGSSIFTLKEPGFFDASVGLVPDTQDYANANFELRVWRGAGDYQLAPVRGHVNWTQRTGGWDWVSTPTGPDLQNPVLILIPEPSVIALGLLGGLGLILNHRKSSRHG